MICTGRIIVAVYIADRSGNGRKKRKINLSLDKFVLASRHKHCVEERISVEMR